MEYRKMEKLGISTSLLGFGCMRFSNDAEGKIDRPKAYALLDRAYAAGVNYFDTAYVYLGGESEKILGEAMSKYPRDSYYVATKLPCWDLKSPEDAEKIFAEHLERLGMDYIDFYLLHAMNRGNFDRINSLGIVDRCAKWRDEGKIRHLGFSFHDNYDAFEHIINARDDWDFCQIQYNYMDQHDQATTRGIELCRERGIPVIVMEPVKGGTLARIPDDAMAPLREIKPDASAASWALRWVGSHEGVNVILSGMNEFDQLEGNLATFGNFEPLDEKGFEAVEKTRKIILSRVRNGCTGCRYCMPCPGGVDIPRVFGIWNQYARYENRHTAWDYKRMRPETKPDVCLKCGACESKCPQGLHIIEDLQRAKQELESLTKEA